MNSLWTSACVCPKNPINAQSKCQLKSRPGAKKPVCECPDASGNLVVSGSVPA